jgi:hypothetical protein
VYRKEEEGREGGEGGRGDDQRLPLGRLVEGGVPARKGRVSIVETKRKEKKVETHI